MATSALLLSIAFLSLLSLSDALKLPKPHAFLLPVKKDPATLQYYTSIDMGTPQASLDLVIDIGERFLWFECGTRYNSSSYRPIHCGTKKCKIAKGTGCITCQRPLKTGCTNNTCGIDAFNPFGEFYVSADVGEDILAAYSTDGVRTMSNTFVPRFLSACVYPAKFGVEGLLQGLAKGTKGVLGLARTPVALPTQLAFKYKLARKFALCLPSSNKKGFGDIFVGGGPYFMPPLDASKFLVTTPLIIDPVSTGPVFDDDPSTEYFIDVKSIKVDDKVVNFNTSLLSINEQGNGGTKISTVIPYTRLHSFIYKAFVDDFVKKAGVRKIKRVASKAPFGACFDAKTIGKSITGPAVPTIHLELAGGVKWRIYGANSMVKVGKSVMCLGFVDGGLDQKSPIATSIIVGGHQLEDNLLEFDLVSSKFGFTSSLLLHNASCSHFRAF